MYAYNMQSHTHMLYIQTYVHPCTYTLHTYTYIHTYMHSHMHTNDTYVHTHLYLRNVEFCFASIVQQILQMIIYNTQFLTIHHSLEGEETRGGDKGRGEGGGGDKGRG